MWLGELTMKMKLILPLLIIFFVAACSDDKNSSDKNKSAKIQDIPTQIGTSFDREIDTKEAQFESSLFVVKSEMSGTQGIAIYLGEFESKKLFAVNKHIVHSEMDDCNSMVSVVDNKNKIFLGCQGFIHSFENLDLSLMVMDFVFTPVDDFEFKPVQFDFSLSSTEEKLTLRSIDNKLKALVVDNNLDCTALDTTAQLITDPHPTNIEEPIHTWSIPVGCDAAPGDSGAPIYNSEDKIVGLLWGGKHNKSYVSSERLKEQVLTKDQALWMDYNFMIPSSEITNQLKQELIHLDSESEEFKVLSKFLNQI